MSDDNGKMLHSFLTAKLKPVYDRYGAFVYSLCLRLLADKKAAESATIEVFVQFNRELLNTPDEMQVFSRLQTLARSTSLSTLRKRSNKKVRRFFYNLRSRLNRFKKFFN
jgi:DNA-directed RNA polymerase specialized sigma24 family protein